MTPPFAFKVLVEPFAEQPSEHFQDQRPAANLEGVVELGLRGSPLRDTARGFAVNLQPAFDVLAPTGRRGVLHRVGEGLGHAFGQKQPGLNLPF
jgi:hypothetical protein